MVETLHGAVDTGKNQDNDVRMLSNYVYEELCKMSPHVKLSAKKCILTILAEHMQLQLNQEQRQKHQQQMVPPQPQPSTSGLQRQQRPQFVAPCTPSRQLTMWGSSTPTYGSNTPIPATPGRGVHTSLLDMSIGSLSNLETMADEPSTELNTPQHVPDDYQ